MERGSPLAVLLQVLPKACNCWCCPPLLLGVTNGRDTHCFSFAVVVARNKSPVVVVAVNPEKMENLQTHVAADGLMITTTTLEKRGHRDDNRAAAETRWFQTCSSHESPSRTGAVGWSGVVPEEGQQREKKGVALGRQTFDGGFLLLCTSLLEPRPPPSSPVAAPSKKCPTSMGRPGHSAIQSPCCS